MARGKHQTKRTYKRPNPKRLTLPDPNASVRIPQNSLLRLADEIQVQIIRLAVTQKAPIRVDQIKENFEKLITPLAAHDHLLAIAETEVYKVNTFMETNMQARKSPYTGICFLPSVSKAADRVHIQHLRLHMDLKLLGGDVDMNLDPTPSRLGYSVLFVLSDLPGVYPNLQTLHLDLSIDSESFQHLWYTLLHRGRRESHSAKWRAWELGGMLKNIIPAFSAYRSTELHSKTLTLNQNPDSRDGGDTVLHIPECSSIHELVWKMMDLPACRLPMTDFRTVGNTVEDL
ncbi:hypothetical protein LTR85_007803 [Meristemomyces frigidus]|nr:hypothetical protein LTR85_007803 [Meristemomyces frigidus]